MIYRAKIIFTERCVDVKCLKLNSFEWYQSRGDLMRFTFWSLLTKWHHYDVITGVKILGTTSKLNLLLLKKGLCKGWHLFYKINSFSLNGSTNTGRTGKILPLLLLKTFKTQKQKNKKQIKFEQSICHLN